MHGYTSTQDLNERATLNEYEAAMRLGNVSLAKRIRSANPDMEDDFSALAQVYNS